MVQDSCKTVNHPGLSRTTSLYIVSDPMQRFRCKFVLLLSHTSQKHPNPHRLWLENIHQSTAHLFLLRLSIMESTSSCVYQVTRYSKIAQCMYNCRFEKGGETCKERPGRLRHGQNMCWNARDNVSQNKQNENMTNVPKSCCIVLS